jgi:hypothetical protein
MKKKLVWTQEEVFNWGTEENKSYQSVSMLVSLVKIMMQLVTILSGLYG